MNNFKKIKVNSLLEWRASQKRLFGLGYKWKIPNVDKWRDSYYFDKDDDLYLVVNTDTKTILYTEEPVPEIQLVGLKEIRK